MPVTRLAEVGDAEELTDLLAANREFLAPWEPEHDDSYFTAHRRREILKHQLEEYAQGRMVPLVIRGADGELAGAVNIMGITRGAFQSASIGYWVDREHNGRGLASEAVADAVAIAFGDWGVPSADPGTPGGLGLHRLQADTLLHNTASQRVLARNGFRPFAIAPSYLNIAGSWQDFVLHQLLNDAWRH
jgi:ribosomal-protein-alanine N-acetyltransferase